VECFLLAGGVAAECLLAGVFPRSLDNMTQGGVAGGVMILLLGRDSVREGGLSVHGPGLGGGALLELLSDEAAESVWWVLPADSLSRRGRGTERWRSSAEILTSLGGKLKSCFGEEHSDLEMLE